MTYKIFDGTDVVRQRFREGESVTDEAGDALPHGVMEALNMIGCAGVLRDGLVLCRRNDPSVDRLWLRIACRPLTVHRRQIRPQRLRARVIAIPDMEGQDVPRLLVHGDPPPWLVRFFRHDAPYLIHFHLQTPDEHFPGRHDRQHMEMIRQGRKAGDDKVHQPPEIDAHRTTDAMEGDFLAQ